MNHGLGTYDRMVPVFGRRVGGSVPDVRVRRSQVPREREDARRWPHHRSHLRRHRPAHAHVGRRSRSAQPAALLLAHLEPRFRDDAGRVLHLRVHAGGACRGRSRDTQEARAEVAHVDRHRRGVRRGGLHRLPAGRGQGVPAVEQRHIAHPVRGVGAVGGPRCHVARGADRGSRALRADVADQEEPRHPVRR